MFIKEGKGIILENEGKKEPVIECPKNYITTQDRIFTSNYKKHHWWHRKRAKDAVPLTRIAKIYLLKISPNKIKPVIYIPTPY